MAKETQIPNSKQDFDLRPPRKLVELAKASWSSLALTKNKHFPPHNDHKVGVLQDLICLKFIA